MKKPSRKQLAIILVIVIIDSGIAYHLASNLVDIKIDFLNINPSDKTNEIQKEYDYPPSPYPDKAPRLMYNGTQLISGLPLFSVTVALMYDGILAENSAAYLTAYGTIYPEGQRTIQSVYVGLESSSPYSSNGITLSNVPPLYAVELKPSTGYTITLINGSVQILPITWTAQGEYYAYLSISFNNGTEPVKYRLDDFKVVVNSLEVIKQDDYNRKTLAATIDGVLLGVINISTAMELLRLSGNKKIKETKSPQSYSYRRYAYYQLHGKKRTPKKDKKSE
jgi:hypothetical protein